MPRYLSALFFFSHLPYFETPGRMGELAHAGTQGRHVSGGR